MRPARPGRFLDRAGFRHTDQFGRGLFVTFEVIAVAFEPASENLEFAGCRHPRQGPAEREADPLFGAQPPCSRASSASCRAASTKVTSFKSSSA